MHLQSICTYVKFIKSWVHYFRGLQAKRAGWSWQSVSQEEQQQRNVVRPSSRCAAGKRISVIQNEAFKINRPLLSYSSYSSLKSWPLKAGFLFVHFAAIHRLWKCRKTKFFLEFWVLSYFLEFWVLSFNFEFFPC